MRKLRSIFLAVLVLILGTSVLSACSSDDFVYKVGSWTDDTTYQNESLEIEFTLPDDFESVTDDYLESLNESYNTYFGAQTGQTVDDSTEYRNYEFMIQSDSAVYTLYVDKLENTVGDADMSEDDYFDIIRSEYTDSGYTVETADENMTKTIAGKEYTVYSIDLTDFGIYQQYALYKRDGYMIVIIAMYTEGSEDAVDSVFSDNFTELK